MASSILALVVSVVGFVIYLIKRNNEKKDTPQEQLRNENAKSDKAIHEAMASGDTDSVNERLDDLLNRVHTNEVVGDPSGQGSKTPSSGSNANGN